MDVIRGLYVLKPGLAMTDLSPKMTITSSSHWFAQSLCESLSLSVVYREKTPRVDSLYEVDMLLDHILRKFFSGGSMLPEWVLWVR